MLLPTKNLVQVTVASALGLDGVSGITADAQPYGLMLMQDPAVETPKLIPADNNVGFFHDHTVVSLADWEAHVMGPDGPFDNTIETPIPLGKSTSARRWEVIEVEGAVHVDTANLDANTAVKTPLKLAAGKWTPCAADGDIIAGILERKLTPKVAANTTRFEIRVANGAYTVPAV